MERMPVEGERFNVFAKPANVERPALVFSTHIDTVPPFLPSREDEENIYGRGWCNTKGIIAAMTSAAECIPAEEWQICWTFVCSWRGARLTWSCGCRESESARLKIPGKRRTHGQPYRTHLKGCAACRDYRARKNGALGVSRARRVGNRKAARCVATATYYDAAP